MSSATIGRRVWLEEHGADVIVAQGDEAGGHRGMFLTEEIADRSARSRWSRRWSMRSRFR